MAGCFQLDNIEDEPLRVNVPPIIDKQSVYPAPDSVVKFYLDGGNADFRLPWIIDANGYNQDTLWGRWWVNYEPTASFRDIEINRRTDTGEPDGSTDEERPFCPGCYWDAWFTVPSDDLDKEGCYQILAVISDSRWETCPSSMCTESPTILDRVTWWVWVAPEGGDLPTMDECADVGDPVNDPP